MESQKVCACGCGKVPRRAGSKFAWGHNAHVIHNALKHGHSYKPEWRAFLDAKYRCTNPHVKDFQTYGARGIKFLFENFDRFFEALGPRPTPQHQLGRKNTAGHYEPGNVAWVTRKEQCANRRPYPRPWLHSRKSVVLLT